MPMEINTSIHPLRSAAFAAFAFALLWIGGCKSTIEVAPIEVKPIHVTLDINYNIDRQLDEFFDEVESTPPATQAATQPATQPSTTAPTTAATPDAPVAIPSNGGPS